VTGLWLSRADGALYATLVRWPEGGAGMLLSEGWGLLWKRTPDTGAPANGRVRKGDLRVNCLPVDPGPVDPTSGLPLRATGPGSTFPLGDTALSCSATDVFGNAATAAVTISVRDTLPPVIIVDSPPEPAVAPAGGAAAVTFAVSAHDAVDGARPVICTHESGAAFPIGITTVTCTAADASNPPHTSQLAFPVIVSPQGGPPVGVPELVLPSAVEAVHASGAPLLVSASSWGGAPLAPSCTPAVGSMLPIGSTAVTCTATDPETRRSVTRSGDVTVADTTAPGVTAPSDLDVDAQGAFGARVTYAATAFDIVDGAVEVSCAPDAGAVFPLGLTPVSCRAVDRAGNQGFAHFNVTVRDRSPAALHLTDMTVDASDSTGARVTFAPAPMATDIAGRPVAIECFPPSGSLFPLGDTAVTCTAAPGTPNEASGTFMIKVERDTTPPVLTLSGPASVTITDCATPDLGAATATDAEGSFVTVSSDRPKTFPLGTTIVTYTARDASGNASTKAQTVTAVLGDDPSCCPAGTNVIIGTRAGEVIVGTPGRDCILGRGGGDRIDGGRGDDLISGGDGDDVIDGGGGDDHIFGGAGDDVLRGGVGMDHLEGGPGRDVLDYFAMRRRARGRLMP
jgi:hypothetical protein